MVVDLAHDESLFRLFVLQALALATKYFCYLLAAALLQHQLLLEEFVAKHSTTAKDMTKSETRDIRSLVANLKNQEVDLNSTISNLLRPRNIRCGHQFFLCAKAFLFSYLQLLIVVDERDNHRVFISERIRAFELC